MSFLNDYKNAGGRVTVSDDASFIYNLFGVGVIEEMELLQEAGLDLVGMRRQISAFMKHEVNNVVSLKSK